MKPFARTLILLTASATLAPSQTPKPAEANPLLVAGYFERLGKALKTPKKSVFVGGQKNGTAFTALPGEPAMLVGIAAKKGDWFGTPIVSALQPIYETRAGRIRGSGVGAKTEAFPIVAEAKPGYVVTQLLVSAPQDHVHGIKIVYRKLDIFHNGVVPNDSYESEWIGIEHNNKSTRIGDATRPAIGLSGRGDDWVGAVGLLQLP